MLLLVVVVPASAQVYKCVDKAGRTTYQQLACPEAQKATRMNVPLSSGSSGDDADGQWSAMAKRREVVVGMPRAFVVQAYGTPEEMRPGRVDEKAFEVWRYRRPDLDLTLGFNKGIVAWASTNFSDAPPPDPDPEQSVRQGFYITRKCADLAVDAGAPTEVKEEQDEVLARKVMRHVWESAPGDRERTIVTCADGVVVRVERIPMR